MKKWAYLGSYLLLPILLVSAEFGGWTYFLMPLVIFGFLPIFDFIIGPVTTNPDQAMEKRRRGDAFFKWVLWAFVPFQWLIVIGGAFHAYRQPLLWWEFFGWSLSAGMMTSIAGITIAHELGHRTGSLDRFLAKALLVAVNYGHFFIEHNQGHHARVATPDDPASARPGESLFAFLPRTLYQSYRHAWQLETRRLTRKSLPIWSFHNAMLTFLLLSAVISVAMFAVFAWQGLVFFLAQSIIAMLFLEMVNYIEHYGLTREKLTNGSYEKVRLDHSWNASEYLSNCFLFELQRHSDHHAFPNRPYQVLRHYDHCPTLPTGYGGMILLALVPPLWRRIMDRRLNEYLTAAN